MSLSNPPAIVRANNPCALRPLAQGQWARQSGTVRTQGGIYCAFAAPVWGVRAGLRNLDTYRRRHGLVTPAQIIGRWAPASDANPETAYAKFIARRVGVGLHQAIPFEYEPVRRLIAAVIRFECGYDAVGPGVIAQAMALMAAEEERKGRDPSPYIAEAAPLKPLAHSKEVAIGGGAATVGIGGAIAYGREAVDVGREALGVGREAVGSVAGTMESAGELACIGSFALLIVFGLAILINRLRARFWAER